MEQCPILISIGRGCIVNKSEHVGGAGRYPEVSRFQQVRGGAGSGGPHVVGYDKPPSPQSL